MNLKNKELFIRLLIFGYVFLYLLPLNLKTLNLFKAGGSFGVVMNYVNFVDHFDTKFLYPLTKGAPLSLLLAVHLIIYLSCVFFLIKSTNGEREIMKIFKASAIVILLCNTIVNFLAIVFLCLPGDYVPFGN